MNVSSIFYLFVSQVISCHVLPLPNLSLLCVCMCVCVCVWQVPGQWVGGSWFLWHDGCVGPSSPGGDCSGNPDWAAWWARVTSSAVHPLCHHHRLDGSSLVGGAAVAGVCPHPPLETVWRVPCLWWVARASGVCQPKARHTCLAQPGLACSLLPTPALWVSCTLGWHHQKHTTPSLPPPSPSPAILYWSQSHQLLHTNQQFKFCFPVPCDIGSLWAAYSITFKQM